MSNNSTWKIVDAKWDEVVNQLEIECGNCHSRFWWCSNISLSCCPSCGSFAFYHDFNESERADYPIASLSLK